MKDPGTLMNPMESFKGEIVRNPEIAATAMKLLPKIGRLMQPSGVTVEYPNIEKRAVTEEPPPVIVEEEVETANVGVVTSEESAVPVESKDVVEGPPPGIDGEGGGDEEPPPGIDE